MLQQSSAGGGERSGAAPVTPEQLRALQLGVLVEVDRLCRAQGLTYYLAYGTLLGAVRHGGFIPWDDDVDVMMPRADYERFLVSFPSTGPAHLVLGCPATQPGWPLPYAKVSDARTDLREPLEVPVELGVNIDVFPVDPLPASLLRRRFQALGLRFWRWALELRYIEVDRGAEWHHPFAIKVVKPVLRHVPVRLLVQAFTRSARRGDRRPAARVGVRVGSFDWSVPDTHLGRPVDLLFEGVTCAAPQEPAEVLRVLYGDYLRLPAEDERVSHHRFTAVWRDAGA